MIWLGVAAAVVLPIAAAAQSPYLAWRGAAYIAAGFAGILALTLMLVQPLLVGGLLAGLSTPVARRLHRWLGGLLAGAVVIHVGGLWLTSPPDVIDVLLLRSPTPFSAWGVLAMWSVLAVAVLAALRRRLRIRPRVWRIAHALLAVAIVLGTVVHAVLIEGTMETMSKLAICALVIGATTMVLGDLMPRARRPSPP